MPEETIRRLLYHTVRELLFNVVKHAEADEARISFRREAERIQVVVEDDGQGYDPKMEQESHLGLASIRERVEILGGTFEVASRPGEGTQVTVEVPSAVYP